MQTDLLLETSIERLALKLLSKQVLVAEHTDKPKCLSRTVKEIPRRGSSRNHTARLDCRTVNEYRPDGQRRWLRGCRSELLLVLRSSVW